MLPDAEDLPAVAPELREVPRVARAVPGDLFAPEGLELDLPAPEPPAVPEVAVEEDRDLAVPEDDVRPPREALHVPREVDPPPPERPEHLGLDRRVRPPDPRHERAPLRGGHDVGHGVGRGGTVPLSAWPSSRASNAVPTRVVLSIRRPRLVVLTSCMRWTVSVFFSWRHSGLEGESCMERRVRPSSSTVTRCCS